MKERPINMRPDEVRAILAGRKTQFRRVMKTQPMWVADPSVPFKTPDADPKGIIRCPFGGPGDRLWVRETTWWRFDGIDDNVMTGYVADGGPVRSGQHREAMMEQGPHYKVPSVHMPRWACRIILEVASVRVERLQDISEEDAIAEGYTSQSILENPDAARLWFRRLWQPIHGPQSWDENPFVWVVNIRSIDHA